MGRDRRAFLSLAAGIGLGAVVAEIYERLYNIPELERRFRSEVSYWMNEYNSAKEMVEKLSQQLNVSRDEISRLSGEVNDWKNRYNIAKEEVNRLSSIVNASDAFERESAAAISVYKKRMEEAIRALQNTIEKYRAILGEERVSSESSSLQVLKDLKIAQEKLLKVLPYFPLIKALEYTPSRVVNDKIYSLNVSLEVISPLNTLKEIEVKLIPFEYRYFITDYGMREEDYDKVFPKEEIKTIKLQPKGLEREMFNVTFTDLKGGREYLIKAIAKDVVDSTNYEERKTSYIREFENVAKTDKIFVGAHYFTWYRSNLWTTEDGKRRTIHTPLLGRYNSEDLLVFDKHIDWATGHGIDFFVIEWASPYDIFTYNLLDLLKNLQLLNNGQMKFCMTYDLDVSYGLGRLRRTNDGKGNYWFNYVYDMSDEHNAKIFLEDFAYLSQFFEHTQYIKINSKPLIFIYGAMKLKNAENVIAEVRKKYDPFLIGQLVAWYPYGEIENRIIPLFPLFNGVYAYNMVSGQWKGEELIYHVEQEFKRFKEIANKYDKVFIPHVEPGYNDSAARENYLIVERSPEFLKKYCQMSLKFLDPKLRAILVATFNEWYEDQEIEPATDYKEGPFTYLQVIRDTLSGTSK